MRRLRSGTNDLLQAAMKLQSAAVMKQPSAAARGAAAL
jgi:hypothetical protein